jgi:hypothetical protein
MAAELESIVAQSLPRRAFQTVITQAIALPDCSGKGKTLFQLKQFAEHKVVEQYRRLAAEVEYRVEHRDAFLEGVLAPFDLSTVAFVTEEGPELEASSEFEEEEPDVDELSMAAKE